MSKKIGLYFGSFNPIHIGHLLVATHVREAAQLDEVWFIVSPQNPFKLNHEMADEQHRLEMVKLSAENVEYFKVSDIEFKLERPSYTHVTLKELTKQFPDYNFQLIIGEDNVANFHEWKEADWILDHYKVFVYRRQSTDHASHNIIDSRLSIIDYGLFDISSTEIRSRIINNKSVKYFVTEKTETYIMDNKLYL